MNKLILIAIKNGWRRVGCPIHEGKIEGTWEDSNGNVVLKNEDLLKDNEFLKYISIDELIEELGNDFMNLRKVWNEKGEIVNFIAESDASIVSIGSTPKEALINLYIALHKK